MSESPEKILQNVLDELSQVEEFVFYMRQQDPKHRDLLKDVDDKLRGVMQEVYNTIKEDKKS